MKTHGRIPDGRKTCFATSLLSLLKRPSFITAIAHSRPQNHSKTIFVPRVIPKEQDSDIRLTWRTDRWVELRHAHEVLMRDMPTISSGQREAFRMALFIMQRKTETVSRWASPGPWPGWQVQSYRSRLRYDLSMCTWCDASNKEQTSDSMPPQVCGCAVGKEKDTRRHRVFSRNGSAWLVSNWIQVILPETKRYLSSRPTSSSAAFIIWGQ